MKKIIQSLLIISFFIPFLANATVYDVKLVSKSILGEMALKGGFGPVLSSNGKYIAFYSESDDLVETDLNNFSDIFLYNIENDTTSLISNGVAGESDGDSYQAAISADGNFVAFSSEATNLVSSPTNGMQIFLYNRLNNNIQLVSKDSTNTTYANDDSSLEDLAISPNGNFVIFTSPATNLVAGIPTNGQQQVYIRDIENNETKMVSLASNGTEGGNFPSGEESVAVSNNGFVIFDSLATNLVAGIPTNGQRQVYIRDMSSNEIKMVSIASNGIEGGNGYSGDNHISITENGDTVYFSSYAPDLIVGDTNLFPDVFSYNPITKEIARIVELAAVPNISKGGDYLLYLQYIDDGISSDEDFPMMLLDIDKNIHTRVSENTLGDMADMGVYNDDDYHYEVSGDGCFVSFVSRSSNLVSEISNNGFQVYLVNLCDTPTPPTTTPTSSKKSSKIRYTCNDINATNYNQFGRHQQSLCTYDFTNLEVYTPTNPKLPTSTNFDTKQCNYFRTYQKQGDQGYEVAKLQDFLSKYLNINIKTDGIFGTITKQAVQTFQYKHKTDILEPWNLSTATGWVYKTTQGTMNEILGCSVEDRYLERVNVNHAFDNDEIFNTFDDTILPIIE